MSSKKIFVFLVVMFFVPNFVYAQDYGLKATADVAKLTTTGDIPGVIGNVVGAGLSLISVLFFILMIYAGIKWMTARGDEGRAKESLDTIFAAIIGIIIVLAAYAITNFVLSSVGNGVGGNSNTTPTTCSEKYPTYVCMSDVLCGGADKKSDVGLCSEVGTSCCSVGSVEGPQLPTGLGVCQASAVQTNSSFCSAITDEQNCNQLQGICKGNTKGDGGFECVKVPQTDPKLSDICAQYNDKQSLCPSTENISGVYPCKWIPN